MTKLVFNLFLAAVILAALLPAKLASAACQGQGCVFQACQGENTPVCNTAKSQGTKNPISGTNGVLNIAAEIVAGIAAVAAIIMIIVSGISLATSGGNAEQAASARRRLMYSLAGLVVVALAYAIVNFAIDNFVK